MEFFIYMIMCAVVIVGARVCYMGDRHHDDMQKLIKILEKQSKYYDFHVSNYGGLSKTKKKIK